MKKCLYFMVIITTLIFAGTVNAATFYVDTAGNDLADFGDVNRPWRTIAHALSNAEKGDTIKINDGVYNEGQLKVPEGVSLTSTSQNASKVTIQPNKSIVGWPFINLSSTRPGSNGKQTISYLSLSGNTGSYRVNMGIKVENRSNVKITHCNIINFTGSKGAYGVRVRSTEVSSTGKWWEYWPTDPQAPGIETNIDALWPGNPVENFELSYCNITNCGYKADLSPDGSKYAAVRPFNLKNSTIHHNTINTEDSWGQPIKATCAFLDNVDIYNNDLTMAYYTDRASWTIELWAFRRGCEIYNNTSNGMFSITVGKETKVHDNTITATWTSFPRRGAGIEFILQNEGEIYNNYIEKAGDYGIVLGLASHSGTQDRMVRNVKIYNNIIYNAYSCSIFVQNRNQHSGHYTVENIEVYNNTCDDLTRTSTSSGLLDIRSESYATGTVSMRNVTIKRNILVNSPGYAGKTQGRVENLVIVENLFCDNYRNSWANGTPTNTTVKDPDFLAIGDRSLDYYKLQSDSAVWGAFANRPASDNVVQPPTNVRIEHN